MKQNIIILIGPSGTGKSTWAIDFLERNPYYLRVNRDDIRKELVGYLNGYYQRTALNKIEQSVSLIIKSQIQILLDQGWDVIVDNTHLTMKYINEIKNVYENTCNIYLEYFTCDINKAKRNVLKRDFNTVTDDLVIKDPRVTYIDKQFIQYENLIKQIKNDKV